MPSIFSYADERRMKVVELGGALDLLTMLETAKDDKTRKEALKALVALSHSGESLKIFTLLSFYVIIVEDYKLGVISKA